MTFEIRGVSWEQLISWLCLSALCWVAAPAPVAAQAERPIAWKAQHRLHARYRTLTARGKTNAHLRRIVIEAAWAYRHRPAVSAALRKRQAALDDEVKAIAWKAQHRLHNRQWRLCNRGKNSQKTTTAVARELLGFVWAIAIEAEKEAQSIK